MRQGEEMITTTSGVKRFGCKEECDVKSTKKPPTRNAALLLIALAGVGVVGCGAVDHDFDSQSRTISAIRYDVSGLNAFRVEVRYGKSVQHSRAVWYLNNLEILPAEEAFADVAFSSPPATEDETDVEVDDDFIDVNLLPLDEDLGPYAWRVSEMFGTHPTSANQQALSVYNVLPSAWVSAPQHRCYTFSSTILMAAGSSGTHYIYRGRNSKILVSSVGVLVGIPSTLATGDWKKRYYRTKYHNGSLPAVIDVTNTCL